MSWQPISTAPRDASYVLVYEKSANGGSGVLVGCYDRFVDAPSYGWWSEDGALIEPTHWMPLPEPPK